MAASRCFLSEDQFLCSVCLDVFTEPVSIPCGHNFCKACISKHWEGREKCQCPLCKHKFDKELKLCVNTAFRDIVEDFKKHSQETSQDASRLLVQPGQVPCDCCLGNKYKASKTCLVCLASYCEDHLESHRTVDALKRHTLTDPVLNLKEKICLKHNRLLELFCRDDLTCICALCTDHTGHETVSLEKAFVNKKCHAGNKNVAIKARNRGKTKKTKAGGQPKRNDDATLTNVCPYQLQPTYFSFVPNENPHNFNTCSGISAFTRCGFWYNIQARHRSGWNLKVVTESMCGKSSITQIYHNGPCTLRYKNPSRSLPNDFVHLLLIKSPECVDFCLDYESELVFFHDPETEIVIYSFNGSKFINRFFFCFIPNTTRIDTMTLLNTIQKSKESNFFCFFVLVCVVIIFIIYTICR